MFNIEVGRMGGILLPIILLFGFAIVFTFVLWLSGLGQVEGEYVSYEEVKE